MGVGLIKTDVGYAVDTNATVESGVTLQSLAHAGNAKGFMMIVVDGQDSSGGPTTFGHYQVQKDWVIVNYIRFNNTDAGGNIADTNGISGGYFESPIALSGTVKQNAGYDLHSYKFILILQSP